MRVEAIDERGDLLVGRASCEPSLDRVREHRDRERRGHRVDDPHLVPADLLCGELGALERAGDLRRDMERVDPLVSGELLVRGDEVLRRRLRGGRRDGRGAELLVELRRARARGSRGTSRRRSGRTAGRSACSGSAPARRGSPTSSRGRSPCSRSSGSPASPPGCCPDCADERVDPLVLAHERGARARRGIVLVRPAEALRKTTAASGASASRSAATSAPSTSGSR